MSNPVRPQNHVSRETFGEFAELQFTEPQNPREVDSVGEFYRDEVDAPSALLTRMRVAAQERGEAPLNAFSANKIMRDFGAVMSGTASKKKSRRAQGWDPRVMGGYSGPGESSRDPKPLGGIVSALIRSRGWKEPVAVSSVLARWAELVGPEIAAHADVGRRVVVGAHRHQRTATADQSCLHADRDGLHVTRNAHEVEPAMQRVRRVGRGRWRAGHAAIGQGGIGRAGADLGTDVLGQQSPALCAAREIEHRHPAHLDMGRAAAALRPRDHEPGHQPVPGATHAAELRQTLLLPPRPVAPAS